jgi:hypothetical protein
MLRCVVIPDRGATQGRGVESRTGLTENLDGPAPWSCLRTLVRKLEPPSPHTRRKMEKLCYQCPVQLVFVFVLTARLEITAVLTPVPTALGKNTAVAVKVLRRGTGILHRALRFPFHLPFPRRPPFRALWPVYSLLELRQFQLQLHSVNGSCVRRYRLFLPRRGMETSSHSPPSA